MRLFSLIHGMTSEMVKSIIVVLTKKEKTVVADANVVVRWML
jgi:hypothetical protein